MLAQDAFFSILLFVMLHTIPEIFGDTGPTHQNVLLMKNWIALMILIQCVTFLVVVFLILQPYVGLWIGVTSAFGLYGWYGKMNTCLLDFWGILSLCGAMFAFTDLIVTLVEGSEPLFSTSRTIRYNILNALWILAILVMLVAFLLALKLHVDRCDVQEESDAEKVEIVHSQGDTPEAGFGTFADMLPDVLRPRAASF